MPLTKPSLWFVFGMRFDMRAKSFSSKSCVCGINNDKPNKKITSTAKLRKKSAETPVAFTIAVSANVKNVKLNTKPVTIPNGRCLPPASEPDRMIGRIGKMHGDRIVTTPARKAKAMRRNI